MCPDRPRRTIEEIVQLHAREGHRAQEVFVEGYEDKFFYSHFLVQQGLQSVAVLPIDSVEIPDDDVLAVGLNTGNKGRVVALAAKLDGLVDINEVVCIADADLDHFQNKTYRYSLLLLTDYTSIELYAFNENVMGRILTVALGGFPKPPKVVMAELAELLNEAFLIRVAAETLGLLNGRFPEHYSHCSVDKKTGKFLFRSRDYSNVTFAREVDPGWRQRLETQIIELRKNVKSDVRLQIHGHDFAETFGWYIRQHVGYGALNANTISTMLLGFVDMESLRAERLFRELLRRLTLSEGEEESGSAVLPQ